MPRFFAGLLLLVSAAVSANEPDRPDAPASKPDTSAITIDCCGRLRHGLVSIGGESTGTTITFDRMVWELNLRNDSARKFAAEHQKEFVRVTGSLRRVRGTEVRVRWIVDVDQIAAPEHVEQSGFAKMSVVGVIRPADANDTSGDQLIIEADGITFPLDLSNDPPLKTTARSLIRKKAALKGLIHRLPGLELPPKPVIRVTDLDHVR